MMIAEDLVHPSDFLVVQGIPSPQDCRGRISVRASLPLAAALRSRLTGGLFPSCIQTKWLMAWGWPWSACLRWRGCCLEKVRVWCSQAADKVETFQPVPVW